MAIKTGCFALINPFQTLEQQVDQIKDWGFKYADITDNADGACLGSHFGFNAVASLDANAFDLKRLFESRGVTITSICSHATLLDPTTAKFVKVKATNLGMSRNNKKRSWLFVDEIIVE